MKKSIHNCNSLLRDGAKPVEESVDFSVQQAPGQLFMLDTSVKCAKTSFWSTECLTIPDPAAMKHRPYNAELE